MENKKKFEIERVMKKKRLSEEEGKTLKKNKKIWSIRGRNVEAAKRRRRRFEEQEGSSNLERTWTRRRLFEEEEIKWERIRIFEEEKEIKR